MQVVYSKEELYSLCGDSGDFSQHPILIDKYIKGKEVEVDIGDGENILILGIMGTYRTGRSTFWYIWYIHSVP